MQTIHNHSLNNTDLSESYIVGDYSGKVIVDCTFYRCSFAAAVFYGTNFVNCRFIDCDLDSLGFVGCKFSEAVFMFGLNNVFTKHMAFFDCTGTVKLYTTYGYTHHKIERLSVDGSKFDNFTISGIYVGLLTNYAGDINTDFVFQRRASIDNIT